MKQMLLTMLEGETRHTSEGLVAGASTVPGPVTEAPAAKKPCSLLFSVYDKILKEDSEVEQLLASPWRYRVQRYFFPSAEGKKY